MNKKHSLGLFLIVLVVVQLACTSMTAPPGTPDTAATLSWLLTAAAGTSTPAGFATSTSAATVTPGLPPPTVTPVRPLPTFTPFVLPTHTPRVTPCDAAAFVKDITYPDGSIIGQEMTFTKIWRLRNVGTCTWTKSYALVFVKGDPMRGPSVQALPGSVSPGETIDLAVTLTAPSNDGRYRGYWILRNASNVLFGIGDQADGSFWVDIEVKGSAYVAYSFVSNFCKAEWRNDAIGLACPGIEGQDQGFVVRLASPRLENGTTNDTPGLLTAPRNIRNGIIRGMYPALTVKSGDRFRSIIQCRFNADNCNVEFRLEFRSGGKTTTLGTWHEVYEGDYYRIDLDLSSLAGKKGRFILVVDANGGMNEDLALWIGPRIVRYGEPPSANAARP
jgi:hypothetical protein